jgi:hypothetical protein
MEGLVCTTLVRVLAARLSSEDSQPHEPQTIPGTRSVRLWYPLALSQSVWPSLECRIGKSRSTQRESATDRESAREGERETDRQTKTDRQTEGARARERGEESNVE